MSEQTNQVDEVKNKRTKLFFTVFFSAILASIALTFYTIEVKGHYNVFTDEENVPDPLDSYRALLEVFLGSSDNANS